MEVFWMNTTIPKVIHYAWFGGKDKPESVRQCIETWEKFLPDYKLIEWNEANFDLNQYVFCKEALEEKKYAFITDVVRLHVLYHFGGIYMDTDVEVLKPLDDLLNHHGFSGFENDSEIPTGIIASEKGNQWVYEQLSYYFDRHFVKSSGELDTTTNVKIITKISQKEHGFTPNGEYQKLKHDFIIYPKDYFCPKSHNTGKITITDNTYTIHHFSGSWKTEEDRIKTKILRTLRNLFGEKFIDKIQKMRHKG